MTYDPPTYKELEAREAWCREHIALLERKIEVQKEVLRRCERWLRDSPGDAPLGLYGQVQEAIK